MWTDLNESTGIVRIEKDPHGKDPHEPGAKLDAGTPRAALVLKDFAHALWEVSKVGTFGANKYSPHGWVTVPNGQERYDDALMRHILQEGMGELVDQDSDILVAAHTAWNALAKLELMCREAKRKGVGYGLAS